ncbi:MAG: hypothetical protein AAF641_10730 [Pseudomonadota bacterium]
MNKATYALLAAVTTGLMLPDLAEAQDGGLHFELLVIPPAHSAEWNGGGSGSFQFNPPTNGLSFGESEDFSFGVVSDGTPPVFLAPPGDELDLLGDSLDATLDASAGILD